MENQKIKELVSKIREELKEPTENISQYLTEIEELTTEESETEKKLYEELGIGEDKEKKKVVQEVQRLAELKKVEVGFKETEEKKEKVIYLNLDQKDKAGNFCPSLVF